MKSLIHLSCLIIGVLLTGCGSKEFNLKFSLPESVNENYSVVYYGRDARGGLTVQAVASVQSGKCDLKCVTVLPTLVYIPLKNSDLSLVMYAEKGNDIIIKGEETDPLSWEVEGNEINVNLTAWRLENLKILNEGDQSAVNHAVEEYVRSNRESPEALILLDCYFSRAEDEALYASLLAYISEKVKNESWLSVVARADRLSASTALPAKIQSMAMRSAAGGTDTVRPLGKKATLLFFWQTGMDNRGQLIDSIKALRKEFPDSTLYGMADISIETDSITWRAPLKKDSLSGVLRLWAPEGLANPNLMKMKVKTIPYFIIVDSLGNQIYRGNVADSAFMNFRIVDIPSDSISDKGSVKGI